MPAAPSGYSRSADRIQALRRAANQVDDADECRCLRAHAKRLESSGGVAPRSQSAIPMSADAHRAKSLFVQCGSNPAEACAAKQVDGFR